VGVPLYDRVVGKILSTNVTAELDPGRWMFLRNEIIQPTSGPSKGQMILLGFMYGLQRVCENYFLKGTPIRPYVLAVKKNRL
jgi:hypothetical protein